MDLTLLSLLGTLSRIAYADSGNPSVDDRLQATLNGSGAASWHVIDLGFGQDSATGYSTVLSFGQYFLAYDDISKTAVLALRGTDSFSSGGDPLDLAADYLVALGNVPAVAAAFELVMVAAKAFASGVGANLYVTGHSLAGALAEALYQFNQGGALVGGAGFGSPGLGSLPNLLPRDPAFVHVYRSGDPVGIYNLSSHIGQELRIEDDNSSLLFPLTAHDINRYEVQLQTIAESHASEQVTAALADVHFLRDGENGSVYSAELSTHSLTIGGSGNDLLDGSLVVSRVRLDGGIGNDTLHGGTASDLLSGGPNNDSLNGATGADFLNGGTGNDTLVGGAGDDCYSIGLDQGSDRIQDGGDGADVVALSTGFLTYNSSWLSADGGDLLIRAPNGAGGYAFDIRIAGMGTAAGQVETLQILPGEGNVVTQTVNLVDEWARLTGGPAQQGDLLINSTITNDQNRPSITTLSDGSVVIAWESGSFDLNNVDIHAQRYSASGIPIGGEFTVNTLSDHVQFSPRVAALQGGGYVVVWVSRGLDGSTDVQGQRFDIDGGKLGAEFQVNSYTLSEQFDPRVSASPNGDFVVTWTSSGQDGSGLGIYGQRFDASASRLGDEFLINANTSSDQMMPAVEWLSDGTFVAVWYDTAGFADPIHGLFFQRFDSAGNKVGDPVAIPSNPAGDQYPEITELADGGFVIAWTAFSKSADLFGPAFTGGVFAQRFNADGSLVGEQIRVSPEHGHLPAIGALPQGGFVVTWRVIEEAGGVVSAQVYGQQFNASGQRAGTQFSVGQINIIYEIAPVAAVGDNSFLVARGGGFGDSPNPVSGLDVIGHLFPVYTDAGNVTLTGTAGPDPLSGGPGNDTVFGLGGPDLLRGNAGDDLLVGGDDDDLLDGGAGDDVIDGGAGIDRAFYSDVTGGVSVSLAISGAQNTGGAGIDTLLGIENLQGSGFGDTLTGNSGDNLLDGQNGDDFLIGADGNDFLLGGAGDDTLLGGAGTDALRGGAGNDRLDGGEGYDFATYFDATAGVLVRLAEFGPQDTGGAGIDTLVSIEAVSGSQFGDTLVGTEAGDQFYGEAGNDSLGGLGGNDVFRGDAGNDTVDGGAGIDQISYQYDAAAVKVDLAIAGPQDTGGSGFDQLIGIEQVVGSAFNDTLSGDGAANLLNGFNGDDSLSGRAGADTLFLGEGNDTGAGGDGDDRIDAGNGNDSMDGGIGNDTLIGGVGSDTAAGGAGNDLLSGGADADSLSGADGNDTLEGGSGDDVLAAGRGADVFIFGTGFGHDTIIDFRRIEDEIRFESAGFTDFADMMAHALQVGRHVVITNAAGDSLQLNNVLLSSLQSTDFLFS